MDFLETPIKGLWVIKPDIFEDKRGYFFESYNKQKFDKAGLEYNFIQDNQSFSEKNVIRALHYQLAPYSQAKLIRVLRGKVLDVAVDLRKNSPTYGQHHSVELSDQNHLHFLIPRGFAHGFSVLSDETVLFYKCDNPYMKEAERGIFFNDSELGIDWGINPKDAVVSKKDAVLPNFTEAEKNFE
jgi:dTDP-4-dehydrorhamnose 3,5-epimerase